MAAFAASNSLVPLPTSVGLDEIKDRATFAIWSVLSKIPHCTPRAYRCKLLEIKDTQVRVEYLTGHKFSHEVICGQPTWIPLQEIYLDQAPDNSTNHREYDDEWVLVHHSDGK